MPILRLLASPSPIDKSHTHRRFVAGFDGDLASAKQSLSEKVVHVVVRGILVRRVQSVGITMFRKTDKQRHAR